MDKVADRPVIWKPNPGPQTEYLQAPEEELLYGGAAGGGKTDALVVDALGLWQGAIEEEDYRAIIFRRTFPELVKVIDRSKQLYPQIVPGAVYNESKHFWEFPSGAQVIFGFADEDKDKYKYQSQEFQFIGWEELTQWPTDSIYKYLFSRLRTPNPRLKCVVRATTNPGGLGHEWVKDRWGIDDTGSPTRQTATLELTDPHTGELVVKRVRRRFIPAKLSDNPYLGVEYVASLMELDEDERKALLDGRWDVVDVPGQIYKEEVSKLYTDHRVCEVPVDRAVQVHTIWDLGVGDQMSIWFVQLAGSEVHFVDFYQNSGLGFPHYAKVLQEKGYVYGTHVAPHDIEVTEMGTGKTRLETAKALGIDFKIAPKLGLEDGIDAARALFSVSWFDKVKCKDGLTCLKNYRRDYNQRLGEHKPQPVHDKNSHGADAFRYVAVSRHMLVEQVEQGVVFQGNAGDYNPVFVDPASTAVDRVLA